LINIKKPLVLVTEKGKENEAVLRLARVGYENVIGYLNGGVDAWDGKLDSVKSVSATEMKSLMNSGVEVLDVRKQGEWEVSHLKNASFAPLSEFPESLSALKKDKSYIVHCGGGYRSMIAISLMKKYGFTGELINIYGGFGAMQSAGLETVTGELVA
jgi:hydroxyacylglutathione hydrolase